MIINYLIIGFIILFLLKYLFILAEAYAEQEEYYNLPPLPVLKDTNLFRCPKCNMIIDEYEHKLFCHFCGRNVAWE